MKSNKGYSLIEVLVAAAVITLSLIAMVAFVRKGHEMIAVQKHRAMARGFVQRQLENPPYQPEYYNTLTTISSPPPSDVVLDTGINLHGSLTVTVNDEQPNINGINAPHRAVTAAVVWTEPGGNNDTVRITKLLTDVQRD